MQGALPLSSRTASFRPLGMRDDPAPPLCSLNHPGTLGPTLCSPPVMQPLLLALGRAQAHLGTVLLILGLTDFRGMSPSNQTGESQAQGLFLPPYLSRPHF